jgi:hypothetical protein
MPGPDPRASSHPSLRCRCLRLPVPPKRRAASGCAVGRMHLLLTVSCSPCCSCPGPRAPCREALSTYSARQLRLMFLLQPWGRTMNYGAPACLLPCTCC